VHPCVFHATKSCGCVVSTLGCHWDRTDPERDSRVLQLTQEGLTNRQIADMVGITCRSVTRVRARHAAVHPAAAALLTVDETARALALLEDGASYVEVAKTLGRNNNTIRRRLPGYRWTPQQTAEYAVMMRTLGKPLGL
jgi:DNA-binding CsgD family transcriptional regulator